MKSITSAALVAGLTLAGSADAFWRMPCRSRTGLERMDPLMDPGVIADHVHAIHGGGNFGFTTTYEDLASSDCTSCEVTQDKSAYWTPGMYFLYPNNTAEIVEQVGGMLAYYLFYLPNVTAFPEGFQMIAGDKYLRNFTGPFPDIQLSYWPTDATGASEQFFLQQRALGFNCLNYAIAPEPSLYRHEMPTKEYMDANCTDGLRLELAFPSCWNGSLDSTDHRSHVAYPSLVKEGNCPDGYDQNLPFLFYETIWATDQYAGIDGQFVLSYGDPTGAGYHGDFIMGWDNATFLQDAITTCTSMTGEIQACSLFNIQNDTEAAMCTFPVPSVLDNDDPSGPRDGLPVDVPIQYGKEPATSYPVAGRSGVATSVAPSADLSSIGSAAATLGYSAANPSVTSTAQGGIIVAAYSSFGSPSAGMPSDDASLIPSSVASASSTSITDAPSVESPGSNADVIATSYMTHGYSVIEMVIEEVQETVYASALPSAGSKHRRHVDHHLNHENVRR